MQPLIPYFTPIEITLSLPFNSESIVTIPGFGVAVGVGLIVANFLCLRYAYQKELNIDRMWSVIAVVNVSIIIGGSIGHGLFYDPGVYRQNPLAFLDYRRGLSSIGGMFVAIIGTILIFRKNLERIPYYADAVAFGFSAGWIFGRLGCVLNHEHIGESSRFFLARFCRPIEQFTIEWPKLLMPEIHDFRFGRCLLGEPPANAISETVTVDFPGIVAVHDLALYEVFYAFALFAFFQLAHKNSLRPGFLFLVLAISYAVLRFALDFLRPPITDPRLNGLTGGQWGLVAIAITISIAMLLLRRYQKT